MSEGREVGTRSREDRECLRTEADEVAKNAGRREECDVRNAEKLAARERAMVA